MADMRPILRRNPTDPLPFQVRRAPQRQLEPWEVVEDEEVGVSLEEQLRCPKSVRGSCFW